MIFEPDVAHITVCARWLSKHKIVTKMQNRPPYIDVVRAFQHSRTMSTGITFTKCNFTAMCGFLLLAAINPVGAA